MWRFAPPIVDGSPEASHWDVVVLFDPDSASFKRWPHEYKSEVESGVSLLDLSPWESVHKGYWISGYAADCCIAYTDFHP